MRLNLVNGKGSAASAAALAATAAAAATGSGDEARVGGLTPFADVATVAARKGRRIPEAPFHVHLQRHGTSGPRHWQPCLFVR